MLTQDEMQDYATFGGVDGHLCFDHRSESNLDAAIDKECDFLSFLLKMWLVEKKKCILHNFFLTWTGLACLFLITKTQKLYFWLKYIFVAPLSKCVCIVKGLAQINLSVVLPCWTTGRRRSSHFSFQK